VVSPLHLIGAGEHARVVAEAASLAGMVVAGAWAPNGTGVTLLGDDAALARILTESSLSAVFHLAFLGPPRTTVRRLAAERWAHLPWASVIHPTAFVSPSAQLGAGVFIGPRAVVHAGAVLGTHAVINSAAVVEHDAQVGYGAHIAPGGLIGGGSLLGDWSMVGLGAAVRDHIKIGAGAVIGMGAVVVGEVPAGSTMLGPPARIWVE